MGGSRPAREKQSRPRSSRIRARSRIILTHQYAASRRRPSMPTRFRTPHTEAQSLRSNASVSRGTARAQVLSHPPSITHTQDRLAHPSPPTHYHQWSQRRHAHTYTTSHSIPFHHITSHHITLPHAHAAAPPVSSMFATTTRSVSTRSRMNVGMPLRHPSPSRATRSSSFVAIVVSPPMTDTAA